MRAQEDCHIFVMETNLSQNAARVDALLISIVKKMNLAARI
jgi:hypothetical protein